MLIVRSRERERYWFSNQLVTFLITGAETGNQYFTYETIDQPGCGPFQLHLHEPQETFHVLEGHLDFFFWDGHQQVTVPAGPGDVLHIAPRQPHGYRNVGFTTSRIVTVASPGGVFEAMFREAGKIAHPHDGPPPAPADLVLGELAAIAAKHGVRSFSATA